jgi:hypothetical protein
VQNELPTLLDAVGRAIDRASFADPQSLSPDADAFIELGVYNGVVASAHKAIKRASRTVAELTADESVRRIVTSHFARLAVVTAAFDQQLQEAVGPGGSAPLWPTAPTTVWVPRNSAEPVTCPSTSHLDQPA